MKNVILLLILLSGVWVRAQQAQGFEVRLSLENFSGEEVYMAQYFGDRPFMMDTSEVTSDGDFLFQDTGTLEAGVYFVVIPPKNDFIQFMLNDKEQRIVIEADATALPESANVQGSVDNRIFHEYQSYIAGQRKVIQQLKGKIQAAETQGKTGDEFQRRIDSTSQAVNQYKLNLYRQYPHTVTAAMVSADAETDMPNFSPDLHPDTLLKRKFFFKKKHFFDHADLSDERLLRSPILKQKMDFYLDRLTPQTADSLIASIDHILERSDNEINRENFQYLFVQILNKYTESNMMGFDAILVHMIDTYVKTGRTGFLDEDTRRKLIARANKTAPTLIGKVAPDITLLTQEQEPLSLHEIDAKYTVLLFWKPSCPTCQKSMPDIKEFARRHAEEGIKVFAICVDQGEKAEDCWPYAKIKGMDELFINAYDPNNRSRFYQKYDLTSTPRILLLDADKKILINKMGAQQLEDLFQSVTRRLN